MSLLSNLFGSSGGPSAKANAEPVTYEGFRITPQPIAEGGQHRIGALIEKGEGDDVQRHNLVRADTFSDRQAASDASVAKAKQMIDEQGDRLFSAPGPA